MPRNLINFREAREGLWDEVRDKAASEGSSGTAVINRALLAYVADGEDDTVTLARRIAADTARLAALLDKP